MGIEGNDTHKYYAFHSKAQGASHVKDNKACQDFSFSGQYMTQDKSARYSVAIVADGHGSENYFRSDRGSEFAVESARLCLVEFIDVIMSNPLLKEKLLAEETLDECLIQLIKSIVTKWHGFINADVEANPFSDLELDGADYNYSRWYKNNEHIESAYGTTLIAFLAADEFCFGLQVGDGRCVIIDQDDYFSQPIPWDEKCFRNVTTSMCDPEVIERFRYKLICKLPIAVFVASDGVDDSFSTMDDNKQLYDFYNNIIRLFCLESIDNAEKELSSYLPILSQKGSKDDISIAVLLDMDAIKERYSEGIKE